MFKSIYAEELSSYYELRCSVLSISAQKHELCYLRRFDAFLCKKLSDRNGITEELVNEWVATLQGKRSSIENTVVVIRQFLEYLQLFGERVFLPVVPKVSDDYIPYLFSDDEISIIFEKADNVILRSKKADINLPAEFPVILRILYSCGTRIGETVRLKMCDVDLQNGILRMVNTKGDKHRLVPMSMEMTDIMKRYCLAMGLVSGQEKWLFPSSRDDGHISDRAVKGCFERLLRDTGITPINREKYERGPCLHCFRHVFAFKSFAQAEKAGRHLDDSIPYLSIYLGHAGLNETAKYLKFSNELFPESVDAFGGYMEDLLPEVDYEA